uniref:Zinc finger protein ZFAT n=1 Tax=Geotrypetes seraphini TaxID=260995 RepID=A0A6P8PXK3_GEOSA|nr:zinc finger protein ZFAT isoform X2 [Geotrypetes seraphini]
MGDLKDRLEESSIFMCKLCNLFSPNHLELLTHVSEKHSEGGPGADDIIIPLRPLATSDSWNKDKEDVSVVKRKRGRPKGSTKKFQVDEEPAENSSSNTQEEIPQALEEKDAVAEVIPDILECRKCSRKFSNNRQLKKHICLIGMNDDGEIEEEGNDSEIELNGRDKEDEKERAPKKLRIPKPEKVLSKELEQFAGPKKPIISVVLTAHEAIPGATKIVPVEATPPEMESAKKPETTSQDQVQRRGYQEYAIQQAPYEQPMKPNRLSSTQLKIFTCEYCNKVFKFKHSLQAHLRIHTNEKPYKCSHCNYASAIKANLCVHMRKHTGEKFTCDYCSFTCLSKGHLKVHIERVHKKIKQHCRFCKKKYSDVKNLIKHIQEAHDFQDQKVKDMFDELRLLTREGKRQLLYDCHICERKFKNELDRDRHMLVHGNERPFACELCGHGATKYQALELHIRKHPFVYVCSLCLKKFVSSIRLRAHIKELHDSSQERAVFNSSVNNSFCLLEPGGDIQQEALEELKSQTDVELTLNGDQPAEVNSKTDSSSPDSLSETLTISSIKQENHCMENAIGTHQSASKEPKASLQSPVVPENLSQKVIAADSNEPVLSVKQKDSSNNLENMQDKDDLSLSGCTTATVNLENAKSSSSSVSTEDVQTLSLNELQPSISPEQNNKDSGNCNESTDCPASSPCNHVSDNPGESTAFMQILDGLKKRQLNIGLFEKIRKVYGDIECEYCGKLFWYQVHYDMHVRTHTRDHLYYCSQCSYSSITKNCLKRHVVQKHSNILLKCSTEGCGYTTPDKYKLQAHIKVHAELDKRSYSCPVCEKSFSEDRLIKSHIKTNHPEVSMSTISEVLGRRVQLKGLIGKRAVKCPYCEFYFMKNGSDLQRHIWAHEGVKPFKCCQCEYATRSKSNLKAHMNRHSTEKTHLCDMCGKKFKSKGTLKSHKLLHTAEGKQYKCTVCDYTAVHRPQLLRHMEQHVSFKPFHCAHCHYSCNIAGSLKRHYNKKHPTEECINAGTGEMAIEAFIQQGGIKCPICNFVYGTKWEFNRHLKNKHGLKVVDQNGQVTEESSTQYLQITEAEEGVPGNQTAVEALQDLRYTSDNGERLDPTAVNILQQIIELGAETHDAAAVASVVAMTPGTVTVVEQVTQEEQTADHTVMIQKALQQASVGLGEQHHLVVSSDEVEGIETVTVYTQGEEASEFIVYVQEAIQPVEEQTVAQATQEI